MFLSIHSWGVLIYYSPRNSWLLVLIESRRMKNSFFCIMLKMCYGCQFLLMTGFSPRRPLRYHYLVCIENHLFIVGIGTVLDKELEFIYQSDFSDHMYVNSYVSEYTIQLSLYIYIYNVYYIFFYLWKCDASCLRFWI